MTHQAKEEKTITHHKTGTRDHPSHCYGSASEWLAAGLELLKGLEGIDAAER